MERPKFVPLGLIFQTATAKNLRHRIYLFTSNQRFTRKFLYEVGEGRQVLQASKMRGGTAKGRSFQLENKIFIYEESLSPSGVLPAVECTINKARNFEYIIKQKVFAAVEKKDC